MLYIQYGIIIDAESSLNNYHGLTLYLGSDKLLFTIHLLAW